MTHILLEGYDLDAPWLCSELRRHILPRHRVAIVAFSFRDTVQSAGDWNALYGRAQGRYYHALVDPLLSYGIPEENVVFINYFEDDAHCAAQKIKDADVLYFPGGLPDRMMDRLREFGLCDLISRFDGVMMGYSAGALIQLREYHLSPDEDYPEFVYREGLPLLSGFYLEVHYEETDAQSEAIARVLRERKAPVYATRAGKGAIIVRGSQLHPLGQVEVFK